MKVLHVIETLGRGGAERLLVMLLPELVRRGYDVSVAVFRGPYDLQPELEAGGVKVIRLGKRNKWNLFRGARDVANTLPDADVLHAHLYFPAICTALARTLGMTKAKTFVTFHNLAYAGANRDGAKLRFRKALARWLYPKGFTSKLAVSQAVAEHYVNELSLDRVKVLFNPIDLSVVDVAQADIRSGDHTLHIVLPGRLVHEKGHIDLIEALRGLHLSGRSLTVTFAGHGGLQKKLVEMTRNLPFPVTITGNLEHPEFLRVLASADIVVVPSRFEGFGLTALEAMALSKPVIASTAGGLPEVLGDTGKLVEIGDHDALAAAILELANDAKLRGAMGRAARSRAEAEFGLPAIATELIGLYEATE